MKRVTLNYGKSLLKREKRRKSKQEWLEERKANEIKLFSKFLNKNQYLFALEKMIGGKAHLGGGR